VEQKTMNDTLAKLRQTRVSNSATVIRLLVGVLFLSTGIMKFAVLPLRAAFSGQLAEANIPFQSLNLWFVPAVEIGVGILFILGFLSRLASVAAIVIMMVATYVHLIVQDPRLFPLQPQEPIIPIIVLGACLYLLWIGSGSWSLDLRGEPTDNRQLQSEIAT
jgi:putative oxidoreductase